MLVLVILKQIINPIFFQVGPGDAADDPFLRRLLFTDECTFDSNGGIHRQNEHHYSLENPHCRKVTHAQVRRRPYITSLFHPHLSSSKLKHHPSRADII